MAAVPPLTLLPPLAMVEFRRAIGDRFITSTLEAINRSLIDRSLPANPVDSVDMALEFKKLGTNSVNWPNVSRLKAKLAQSILPVCVYAGVQLYPQRLWNINCKVHGSFMMYTNGHQIEFGL
ncbi:unnamed protein product [Caretta caretta]